MKLQREFISTYFFPYRMADPFANWKVDSTDEDRKFGTLQVHAGHKPDSATKSRAVPIYATAVSS
jgi:O-acetylhomoserine/O-acetylserine sulfhydrylase